MCCFFICNENLMEEEWLTFKVKETICWNSSLKESFFQGYYTINNFTIFAKTNGGEYTVPLCPASSPPPPPSTFSSQLDPSTVPFLLFK